MGGVIYFPDLDGTSSCLIVNKTGWDFDAGVLHPLESDYALAHYPNAARREEWSRGRSVLKTLLMLRFGTEPGDAIILSDENHRPLLVAPKEIGGRAPHVSLAHKGEFFMAGASLDGPVGVDLEIPHGDAKGLDAIRRACRDTELRAATEHPDLSEKDFLHLTWCLKECCVKAGVARSVFDANNTVAQLRMIGAREKSEFFNARFFSFDKVRANAWIHEKFYAAMVTS